MNNKKQQVLDYIDDNTHDALYFTDDVQKSFELLKDSSLHDCVELVLTYTQDNYSCRKLGGILINDTYPDCTRSSIDIWRHILSIKPEVTIFEVMETMYNMSDELVGQFCDSVDRRVFRLKKRMRGWILADTLDYDEYGLEFPDWRNINDD